MTTLAFIAVIFFAVGLITGLNLASARHMVDNARYVLTPKGDDVLDQATRDRMKREILARIEREEGA